MQVVNKLKKMKIILLIIKMVMVMVMVILKEQVLKNWKS